MLGQPLEIAIVGGGIVGSAVAFFLAKEHALGRATVVLEPDPTYAWSSTARSAAAIRQQFRTPANIEMSRFGWAFYSGATEDLSERPTADLGVVERPYVVVASDANADDIAEAHDTQRAAGVAVELVGRRALAQRLPWLDPHGVAIASVGLGGEGWLDPMAALRALRARAQLLGVRYVERAVRGFERTERRVSRVVLDDSSELHPDVVVNAAGRHAGRVARLADIDVPIESRKRSVYVFATATPPVDFPNLVDTTLTGRGLYVRPYGAGFIAVTSPGRDQDPESWDFEVHEGLFDDVVRPALARRVRGFRAVELADAWAGHYELNTFDQNAVLGHHPDVANLVFAAGSSGHGVMHAPAIGRGIAELIATGSYRSIDLGPFGFARIRDGRRLVDTQPSEGRLAEWPSGAK